MVASRDSFALRISRRLARNCGKVCAKCGEANPILIVRGSLCPNCASRHREEKHHLLGEGFRTDKYDRKLVVPVTPSLHRLLTDLQANHPLPADPAAEDFAEKKLMELVLALADLWLAASYLQLPERWERGLEPVFLIALGLLLLPTLFHFDTRKLSADEL
jgi:hypothetical protein